jgi:hypothetical protein
MLQLIVVNRGRIMWGGGFSNPLSAQSDAFLAEVVNGNQSPGVRSVVFEDTERHRCSRAGFGVRVRVLCLFVFLCASACVFVFVRVSVHRQGSDCSLFSQLLFPSSSQRSGKSAQTLALLSRITRLQTR